MLSLEPCATQAGVLLMSYTSNMRMVFMALGMWFWLRGTAESPDPPGVGVGENVWTFWELQLTLRGQPTCRGLGVTKWQN